MISFRPTEDELAFLDIAEKLASEKIQPNERSTEQTGNLDPTIVEHIRELGFLSMELPEEWDGLQFPLVTQSLIWMALSKGDLAFIQSLPGAGDASSVLRLLPKSGALEEFRNTFLKKGTSSIAFIDGLLPEWNVELQLERNSNGFVLRGETAPIKKALDRDFLLIALRNTAGEAVIFYLDQPENWQVYGEARLGLQSAKIGRIRFPDVTVTEEYILSEGRAVEKIINEARTRMYILEAAKEVGLAERALDYATAYTAERKAFGEPIAKFQGVSFRIADMAMEVRAAKNLVLEAAFKVDRNKTDAALSAIRALSRSHRAVRFNTDSAVQLLGGHGYVSEYPAEKWMRDARAQISLYGGEQGLLMILGEQLLDEEKVVMQK